MCLWSWKERTSMRIENAASSRRQSMSGSGLAEVLECCYGPNTVAHMLTGKAFSRATRSHLLLDDALNAILLGSMIESVDDSPESNMDTINQADVDAGREHCRRCWYDDGRASHGRCEDWSQGRSALVRC